MAAPYRSTLLLVALGEGAGRGGGAPAPLRPASYGKPERARWPLLRRTVVLGPTLTGNWKSSWKVRARNGRCPTGAVVRGHSRVN